ncbi:helix-turn-helix protein [Rhodococcus sp. SMB37]|uniref:ArsR/SmtB family transcription factor n=1 Tax=Rhodococcus sp. SMB37 TaxID=2512213 RepID=UPI0006D27BA0|nr:metalloregulator ArsR/SmtB family transcription factor [Rhodococcus sp. SMB37]TCN45115.1 helix-turn-helix protein [Rhodococcus sp. SMB37]
MPHTESNQISDTARVFAALADDTRWRILQRLGRSPASASGLASEFTVSRQAIAKHLAVLEASELVTSERVGRELRFAAAGSRLSAVGRALDAVGTGWDRRLDAIKEAAEHPR